MTVGQLTCALQSLRPVQVPERRLGQPGYTSTATYTRAFLQGIHMFLRKAWGEHESQVDDHFKLRTLGTESAPSSQAVPRNLFFSRTTSLLLLLDRLCCLACPGTHVVLLSKCQHGKGRGTAWRCSVPQAALTCPSGRGTGTTRCVGQGTRWPCTEGCWSHWLAP